MADRNIEAFFQSIDEDVTNVIRSDIDNRGYYVYILDADGKRQYHSGGYSVREFRAWPNPYAWSEFIRAVQDDKLEETP